MMRKLSLRLFLLLSLGIFNLVAAAQQRPQVPSYLVKYKSLYQKDPKLAAIKWFDKARFGLFIHWGASTYYKKGEWNMFYSAIPIKEYQDQAMKFKGEKFNADSIVQLAKNAQMQYITFVVQHHDGFALYDSKAWPFNSMQADSHRDFLKELASACEKESIGLFIYYSLGINWTHPFYLTKSYYNEARPAYKDPQPEIRFKDKSDFVYYWNTVKAQIAELCSNYGPLAGFWFDPIGGAYTNPDLFDIQAIYDQIRHLQPQALISYKTGFNGNEDYISCEHEIKSLTALMRTVQGEKTALMADKAWQSNRSKKAEMCTTMQHVGWGYEERAKHKNADEVWTLLENTAKNNANLLLNIGPYPDGSIVPIDRQVLTEIGKRIKQEGFPKLNTSTYMHYRDGENKKITDRDLETGK